MDRSTSLEPVTHASGYPARDVARLLGLSLPQIAGLVKAGCVSPRRGPRRELRFSFEDLVLLRTAKDLIARMPARRVHRALLRLREQLPAGRQLTALRLSAEGEDIVVRDGGATWNPESGQAVLDLGLSASAAERRVDPGQPATPKLTVAAREEPGPEAGDAEGCFRMGCDAEPTDPDRALDAYRRAIELAPDHADAHLNLGRMLHEAGRVNEAESHYRRALEARPGDATAAYNLGVALEDLRRPHLAAAAYERALAADPECADAHFNLARLWERLGHRDKALRHLQAYGELAGADPDRTT